MQYVTLDSLLQGGTLVAHQTRIWSGAAAIRRETDLPEAVARRLPPRTLASDGVKRLINPTVLNPLDALRKRADAALRAVGSRLLGAWYVPDTALQGVLGELAGIAAEFDATRDDIAPRIPTLIGEWAAKADPQWRRLIAAATITPDEFRARCAMRPIQFRIAPPADEAAAAPLLEAADSFREEALAELAGDALEVLTDTFLGRTVRAGQRALRPVRALATKAAGLGFLAPGIAAVARTLDAALAQVPDSGYLDDEQLAVIAGALRAVATRAYPAAAPAEATAPVEAEAPAAAPVEAEAPAAAPVEAEAPAAAPAEAPTPVEVEAPAPVEVEAPAAIPVEAEAPAAAPAEAPTPVEVEAPAPVEVEAPAAIPVPPPPPAHRPQVTVIF